MRIAYIGDWINHGKFLKTFGTSLIILLSLRTEVSSIDVYCPQENEEVEKFVQPQKVNIVGNYNYDDPISIIKILKMPWSSYDKVIFNLLPTGFGNGIFSNMTALILPLFLTRILRMKQIVVIYHNSVFTNDVKTLGYDSFTDKIKAFYLGIVERFMFKNVKTFVLLNLYKDRIDHRIGKNKVNVYKAEFVESISTTYINNVLTDTTITKSNSITPLILMHGYWGPQKNLSYALSVFRSLKESGYKFKLVISGGINHHFSNFKADFTSTIELYKDVIDAYLGYLNEKDIMKIFIDTDLIVLPYNTPGGHSGVLEQAMFFEVQTIVFDFPEYKEQTNDNPLIKLIKPSELNEALMAYLNSYEKNCVLNIENKIRLACDNIKAILK